MERIYSQIVSIYLRVNCSGHKSEYRCINFPRIRNCDHFVPVVLIPDFSEMNASTRQKLHQLNSIWATAVLIVSLLKMI